VDNLKGIEIEFLSVLSDLMGEKSFIIEVNDKTTIKRIFDELANKLGKKFIKYIYNPQNKQISKHSLVILNERDINTINGLDTQVNEGDKIIFIPAIAGG
jgi:molybdopterin synthase sulfur carrier subunit